MKKVREFLGNSASMVYFLICLIIIGTIIYFLFGKKNDKYSNLEERENSYVPSIYVPTQSTNPNSSQNVPEKKTWPKDFYVIAESFSPKNQSGNIARVYNYGEKIVLSESKEIIENGAGTGNFIEGSAGLVSSYFYPTYQRIFPVNVSSYKKLPLDIKYKLIIKADSFCNFPAFSNQQKLMEILFLDEVPPSFTNYAPFDPSSCNPNFTMPKSQFVAENSVAYSDLDSNPNTPDNILVLMELVDSSAVGNCNNIPSIFSVDANGHYYRSDVATSSVCYVSKVKKGTVVPITKVSFSSSSGIQSETKSSFKIPSDAFALHLVSGDIDYLFYDKTTSNQIRIYHSRQNQYDFQYRAGGGN